MTNKIKQKFLEGKYLEVLELIETSSKSFEEDKDLLFYYLVSLNEVFVQKGDVRFLDRAKRVINNSEPLEEAALLRIASLTHLHSKNYGEAVEYAEKALERDPSSSTFLALGNAYRANKDFDKAIFSYQKAITNDSITPEINLFELYQQLKELNKARETAQIILEKIKEIQDVSIYKGYVKKLKHHLRYL